MPTIVLRASPILLVAVAALLLPACGGSDPEGARTAAAPAAAPAASVPGPGPAAAASTPARTPTSGAAGTPPVAPRPAGPQLTFDSVTHDFGVITDSISYRASLPFENTGSGSLVIRDVKAACGCTVPTLAKRTLAPGERGALDVVFDPKGKKGPTRKEIKVISNAGDVVTLELKSDIWPLVNIDTIQQLGEIALHEEYTHTVPIRYTDPDLRILEASVNDPEIEVEVVETGILERTDDGAPRYRGTIELTIPRDFPWGIIYGRKLTVKAQGRWRPESAPVAHTYSVYVLGRVFGSLRAEPPVMALGPVPRGGTVGKSFTLSSRGGPFKVTAARVLNSTLAEATVEVLPRSDTVYEIVLSGRAGATPGFVEGRIGIETDMAGEGFLEVPLSGQIK